MTSIAVIILTFNEEANISYALDSVNEWANEIYVLDSFSTDNTVQIVNGYGIKVFENEFQDFGKQRNYALEHLPIQSEWVFFLDADEWLPGTLKNEINNLIADNPKENGFYIKWRLMWMGRWVRRGYYPTWVLRLFRYGKASCGDRGISEHLIIDGEIAYLENDFIHEDRKGVADWTNKHNDYSSREARELLRDRDTGSFQDINADLFGTQAQRKLWVRYKIWERLPLLVRPFLYFFYRYILRGGFLDGRAGFIFHFLQGLWYPMLISIKYLELRSLEASSRERTD